MNWLAYLRDIGTERAEEGRRDYFSSAFLCFFFSIFLIFINFHFTAGKSSTPVNPKRFHSGLPFLTDIRNFLSSFVKDSLIEDTRVLRRAGVRACLVIIT